MFPPCPGQHNTPPCIPHNHNPYLHSDSQPAPSPSLPGERRPNADLIGFLTPVGWDTSSLPSLFYQSHNFGIVNIFDFVLHYFMIIFLFISENIQDHLFTKPTSNTWKFIRKLESQSYEVSKKSIKIFFCNSCKYNL